MGLGLGGGGRAARKAGTTYLEDGDGLLSLLADKVLKLVLLLLSVSLLYIVEGQNQDVRDPG